MSEFLPGQNDQNPKQIKRERFIRVAERRTKNVLENIRRLSKCSSKSSYEYDEKDVEKIFNAIESELAHAKSGFIRRKKVDFSLHEEDKQ